MAPKNALFGSFWLHLAHVYQYMTAMCSNNITIITKQHFDMIKVSRCDSFKENDEICDIFNIFRVQIGPFWFLGVQTVNFDRNRKKKILNVSRYYLG